MGWEDYLGVPLTPSELQELYENNTLFGIMPDPAFDIPFNQGILSFYEVYPDSKGIAEGKLVMPYLAPMELDREYGYCESQTTGDCVSHSTRNAGMLDYCIDAVMGETSYEGRLATENIYGARGHSGQGATCGRLAAYVSTNGAGGFLVRRSYDRIDLSVYDSRIGHNWGSTGPPSWLNTIASENKALRVLSIRSRQEERDALALGFGISACSGLSFQNTRNSDGVSQRTPQGWSHAMAHIGYDDTPETVRKYGEALVLIQNSWGKWNNGPLVRDQPEGSFWTPAKFSDMMDRYVIGSLKGYKRQVFNHLISKGWIK